MQNRENSLDLLRIIAAIFIVEIHVYIGTTLYVETLNEINGLCIYYKGLRVIEEVAVPVFFMLSGAFVLASNKTADYKNFYVKTWKKLGIPTLIFSIFYFFEKVFFYSYSGIVGDTRTAVKYALYGFVQGKPEDHMWYMFTLIGLYLISPCIVTYKQAIGDSAFKKTAWIMWGWGTLSSLLVPDKYAWSLGFCVNMLGIYMLGFVAHEWGKQKKGTGKGWLMFLAGTVLILAFALITLFAHDLSLMLGGSAPDSVMITLSAFFFVAAFSSFDIKKNFGIVAASTFWVYLIHPIFIMIVRVVEEEFYGIKFLDNGVSDPVILPNVNFVIVLVLSFACGIVIERIVNSKTYNKKKTGVND